MGHLDVAGVRRSAASYVEVTSDDEIRSAENRFLVMQPSLDESWWKIWGGFDGIAGAAIDDVLTQKADAVPELPDGTRGTQAWRRATALFELATGGVSPKAQITVFVDADNATRTDGKAGVRLEAGPRVGARALALVMCDSVHEVTINAADGVPMRYGRKSRGIPRSLRTAILATNHGYCQADGCNSRYRVEVHHRAPWALGGRTDPENLVALCWFHHHIVVHERGFELHDDPTSGRLRFRRPRLSWSDDGPPPASSSRMPKG
jgi:hypothetical protein